MLFSIVIPCYPPHFKFLDSLIENINEFNIQDGYSIKEIIVAASQTNNLNITYPSKYPIIIHSTMDKCNAAMNRNRAWSKVSGDWIVFLDADDYYHPEKLLVTYNAINQYPDIDCIVHRFHRGKRPLNKDILIPVIDPEIISPDIIFKETFPEGQWKECNPNSGGCNIKIPNPN